jgi:hypothetical protein
VNSLRENIQQARAQYDKEHGPPPVAPPAFSARVRHKHRLSYCQGTLRYGDHQLIYHGETASRGKPHELIITCSTIRVISQGRHNGEFEVQTSSGESYKFEPENPSEFNFAALKSACGK